jgi:hypothetical protein
MKLIKLTVIPLFFGLFISFTSCEKNTEKKIQTDFSKSGIVMSPANEPNLPVPSSGLGTMDVAYSRETRVLTYSVSWSGLTGPVIAMHIHGQAPAGFNASVFQNIITSSNGIVTPGAAYGASGKISASLFIDGVTIKEADLLNGFYYMNIHTAANSGGEIRGQIRFQ